MSRTQSQVDRAALYGAALEGLELQKQRVEDHIRMVRSLAGGKKTRASSVSAAERPSRSPAKRAGRKRRRKRILSPEARERIAEAQRKRWANFRGDS